MDRLWTPWRFDYIRKIDPAVSAAGCIFCAIFSEDRDRANLILYRGKTAFIVLNLFPYNTGHMLLVANRHIPFLRDAQTEELHEMLELAQRCEAALSAEYRPDGFNMGFNLGRSA